METTPGFDIVCDRGAFVLDVDVNDGVYVHDEMRKFDNDSGISFPVIRTEQWERAMGQPQQNHERKQAIHQDVHGVKQNTFEQVKVKVQRSVSPTRPRIVLPMLVVRSASRPRALTESALNNWGTRNIFP